MSAGNSLSQWGDISGDLERVDPLLVGHHGGPDAWPEQTADSSHVRRSAEQSDAGGILPGSSLTNPKQSATAYWQASALQT